MNNDVLFGRGMGFVVLIGALLVVIIIYLIKTWQTKIQITKEKELLEQLHALHENTAKQQTQLLQEVQDLNDRVKNVEKILQEVE